MCFYVLKMLHDNLITNTIKDFSLYKNNPVIIYQLIFHTISQSIFINFMAENVLSTMEVAHERVNTNVTNN